jgi:hypothetical protein
MWEVGYKMASVSQEVMRAYVSKQYGGSWPQRVALMPDDQVAAIYLKMLERNDKLKDDSREVRGGKQLNMFEEGYFSESCE